jgi:hypothetical protein
MKKLKTVSAAAREQVAQRTTHGMPRAEAKRKRIISSVGTERTYRQQVKSFYAWRGTMGLSFDDYVSHNQLLEYLEQLAEIRSQKGLDQARQALQWCTTRCCHALNRSYPTAGAISTSRDLLWK